jgi:hypothetical protein
MKNKLFNYFLIASLAAMSLVACVKKEVTPLRNEGDQLLKIQEAPEAAIFSEPYSGVRTFKLFSLIRSSANETQAAKATSFKITAGNQADVDAYNTENDTEFELLPDSLYTMASGVTKSGSTYTIPFASGDFEKEFSIVLNGSKWDLKKKYAMKYTITDSAGVNLNEGNKEIMVLIAIANRWDGVYTLKGYHTRSPYNFPYSTKVEMRTAGETAVAMFWNLAGAYGHPIGVGPDNDLSWYGGGIAPVFVFDPVTDKVTNVYNTGSSTPFSFYTGPGSGESRQDKITKTIYLYWRYNANDARAFIDTLTYVGKR